MTRLAILTAATGNGHLAAARALAEVADQRGMQAQVVDVGRAHPLLARLVGLYNAVLRRPPRWMAAFFAAVNGGRLDRLAFRPVRGWAVQELGRLRPEGLLSVHPMVNYGVAETLARAGGGIPFAVTLTDLAPPFWRGWAHPAAALTTAPTAEALAQLAAWGIPRERLDLAPIPVSPRYRGGWPRGHREELLRTLGLETERFTVALSAGTAGRCSVLRTFRALARASDLAPGLQAILLAGRDPSLLRRAQALRPPFPAVVVPWQEDLQRILGAVDALFSKPGGLTVCEALAAGVPLLLDACGGIIPQERGGARWVVAAGAGWIVEDPQAVPALLRGLSGADWETARRRARAALPGDAGTVLDRVMAALGASPWDGGGFGRPTLARAAAATGAAGRGGPEA